MIDIEIELTEILVAKEKEIDKLKAAIKEAQGWLGDIVRATSYVGTTWALESVRRKAEFALDGLSGMEVSDERI